MPVWARARLARRAHGIASDGRHHTLPRLPHGPRAVCVLLGVLQGSCKGAAGLCGEMRGEVRGKCQLIIREIPVRAYPSRGFGRGSFVSSSLGLRRLHCSAAGAEACALYCAGRVVYA